MSRTFKDRYYSDLDTRPYNKFRHKWRYRQNDYTCEYLLGRIDPDNNGERTFEPDEATIRVARRVLGGCNG